MMRPVPDSYQLGVCAVFSVKLGCYLLPIISSIIAQKVPLVKQKNFKGVV
jgi:hypothetical protein